jgi:hypothetical protein
LQALFQSTQYICEIREGSGAESVPLTNGSGSGRPINIRIRIPNTGYSFILILDEHFFDIGNDLIITSLEANSKFLTGGIKLTPA